MHSALIPFARQHDLPAGRKLVLQKMPVKPGRGEHPVFGQHFAGETGFTPVAQYRHAGDLGLNGNFVSVLDFTQGTEPVILIPERVILKRSLTVETPKA